MLLQTRLYPDMFPLVKQVQIASDITRRGIAKLACVEVDEVDDNELSFGQLAARFMVNIDCLNVFNPSQINGIESSIIEIPIKGQTISIDGQSFLLYFVLPNVFFHVTTLYSILRHCGVKLGKINFLGQPPTPAS